MPSLSFKIHNMVLHLKGIVYFSKIIVLRSTNTVYILYGSNKSIFNIFLNMTF